MHIKPSDLTLRCMGYQSSRGVWVAKCIDLDLVAEGDSLKESHEELFAIILSYLDTIFTTDDNKSIPHLLLRKSPWHDRLLYHFLVGTARFRHWRRDASTFYKMAPMRPEAACR